jgi:hypothetical protein
LEKEGKAANTLKKKRWMLGFVSSHLNHRPITEITAADILVPLRDVEGKGNYETAGQLRAGNMRWIKAHGFSEFP